MSTGSINSAPQRRKLVDVDPSLAASSPHTLYSASAPQPYLAPGLPLRVLIIEDYEEDALLLRRHLARAGYAVEFRRIETAAELHQALADPAPWDLVLADYTLPGFGARDALRIIQTTGVDLPFIIVSGTIDEVSAVDAMRAGAHDYVLKGHIERLLPAIERELADARRRLQDNLARKAAERESADLMQRLINSERLAAAGRMANTLAHEINNPLEALTNIFYILQTHEDLSPQSQELIDFAARELDRVGHITRSTLSFYRKVPGRTLDLYSMLEEVVQLFKSRASQHQVEMHSRFDERVRAVRYDPSLRQVFANLVGNALEAMAPSGGRILLRARQRGSSVLVTVADTGLGIDPANLGSIFEPFFTTKGERGTGLGLWVTRGIVEEQGGKLQLRSRTGPAGHGTVICITLPMPSPPAS
jgi:signal transduction histidine kinase